MQQRIGAFIHSEEIEGYHYPADCPFKTERAAATKALLRSSSLFVGSGSREVAPRPATEKELLLFHSRDYLEALRRISKGDFRAEDLALGLGTPDTPVFADLYPLSELAAGATITGAEMILHGNADFAFNPSGGFHHAFPSSAGGFSYINDVVLGCKVLGATGKRVLCLDLDAHHGNGTQAAFYGSPAVLTVSFHESGRTLFPWSGFEDEIGEGKGFGYNVNVPLPSGTGDDTFLFAFTEIVPPLIAAYKPEVVVVGIGMDALEGDPLAHLALTNNAIADALLLLVKKGLPLLVLGGGGYDPAATARAWALAWTILCGSDAESEQANSLRDKRPQPRANASEERTQVEDVVHFIKQTVFPLHKISV